VYGLPVQTWELAGARTEWGNILLHIPAEQRRPVYVKTASGGETRTYQSLGSVNCFIERGFPGEPRDVQEAAGQMAEIFFSLSLPVTLTVQRDDQFIIGGLAYEVVDTDDTGDADLSLDIIQTVRVRRLKGQVTLIFSGSRIASGAAVQAGTLVVA
jgi:hypothetical protein